MLLVDYDYRLLCFNIFLETYIIMHITGGIETGFIAELYGNFALERLSWDTLCASLVNKDFVLFVSLHCLCRTL